MLRPLSWLVSSLALVVMPIARAIELPPKEESFINDNIAQFTSGETEPADKSFAEFAAALGATEAGLAYAERGHRLYLQGADGSASYAAALKRDPKCHLAEVYGADAEIDAGDYEAALRKLRPANNDAPEGVEWGMYALALQLRGHPEDRGRIRDALAASRARTTGLAGFETLRAWVLSLIADKDLGGARQRLTEMSALDASRSEFGQLEAKLQACEIEARQAEVGEAHDLLEKARSLEQDGKYAEALDLCAAAAALRDTDEAPNLIGEINYVWSQRLWAKDKMEAAAKLRAALAATRSGGLRALIRAGIDPIKAEAGAAFQRKDYAATLSLCETLIEITPHDHEIGAMKAIALMEQTHYPESIRAWIELSAQEEEPDKAGKLIYDRNAVSQAFIKAYAVILEAQRTGGDARALGNGLIALREPLAQHGLASSQSHFCLGVALELQGRSHDADVEWDLARTSAPAGEKARLEELIGPFVAMRAAKAQLGPNYDVALKYGAVVNQLVNEWLESKNPDFTNPLRKQLAPIQQARWDEIIILIQKLHEITKGIDDITQRNRVAKSIVEGTKVTEDDIERMKQEMERRRVYNDSLIADGRRIQALIEKKVNDFWRP